MTIQLGWYSTSLACLRPWVWSQRLRLLKLPNKINKWTINSLTLAYIYLFFTKLFFLCGLISNLTVLAAVAAHALGHIHTDPTEYLTLIESMKTWFLFHNQGTSLSSFTLSGVCGGWGGGLRGHPFCAIFLMFLHFQFLLDIKHQSVLNYMWGCGLAGVSTSPEYPKLGPLCPISHGWYGMWPD